MKPIYLAALLAVFSASCTSQKYSNTKYQEKYNTDDAYFSPKDLKKKNKLTPEPDIEKYKSNSNYYYDGSSGTTNANAPGSYGQYIGTNSSGNTYSSANSNSLNSYVQQNNIYSPNWRSNTSPFGNPYLNSYGGWNSMGGWNVGFGMGMGYGYSAFNSFGSPFGSPFYNPYGFGYSPYAGMYNMYNPYYGMYGWNYNPWTGFYYNPYGNLYYSPWYGYSSYNPYWYYGNGCSNGYGYNNSGYGGGGSYTAGAPQMRRHSAGTFMPPSRDASYGGSIMPGTVERRVINTYSNQNPGYNNGTTIGTGTTYQPNTNTYGTGTTTTGTGTYNTNTNSGYRYYNSNTGTGSGSAGNSNSAQPHRYNTTNTNTGTTHNNYRSGSSGYNSNYNSGGGYNSPGNFNSGGGSTGGGHSSGSSGGGGMRRR